MENFEIPSDTVDLVTQFGYKIIAAVLIFFIGRWIAKLLVSFAKKLMANAAVEDTLQRFLANLMYAVLMAAIVIKPILLKSPQVAEALGLCERTVWDLTKNGHLKSVKIGSAVRYRPEDVEEFAQSGSCIPTKTK